MTEDITKDLTDSEKLNLILARLAALEDDRARDTRPLLGEIRKEMQQGFARIEDRLSRIERNFGVLTRDMIDLRARQDRVEERFDEIGGRPS